MGAKLYYPDDTLQHAGVVIGLGGLADHPFRHLPRQLPGYQWLPFLTQDLSAVTGACMVMRREVFEAVNGFDEKNLTVAFNDIDLCLRIREQGYRILWTPHAELYHHESISRGADNTPTKYFRLQREIAYMQKRWQHVIKCDPYYNPNLSLDFDDYALSNQRNQPK
ncbi:MAG: glycosyltransferase [Pseudomonadota bacterium]